MGTVPEGTKAERFRFIKDHCQQFTIRYLCRKLFVSHQGYYKWLGRTEPTLLKDNRRLLTKIQKIFDQNDGNYGSPRVYKALRKQGEGVNHKRVERLMREARLVGKAARVYRTKALAENSCITVDNTLRSLEAPKKPNEQWTGDVSYLKVNGEWQYLAVVLDIYSRKIVGWSLSERRNTSLTLAALNRALKTRTTEKNLVFHSDRGSEYGAHVYQDRLRESGIKASMNRPGFMNDNIYVETFFQTLKTESFKGLRFKSPEELSQVLSKYIDRCYNTKRLHSAIGYEAPSNYERMNS